MSQRWIAVGAAGLGVVLGAVALSPVWMVSRLLLSRDTPTPAPVSLSVTAPPVIAQPARAPVEPSPAPRPLTHGINRATRAALINGLGAALGPLKPRLERCPDQHMRRAGEVTATQQRMIEFVQRQITSGGNGEEMPVELAASEEKELPTILMLEVETYDSQVKILDVALAMSRASSEAFVACARQVLRGQIIVVPAATPGEHLQIPLDLDGTGVGGQPQRHTARRRR